MKKMKRKQKKLNADDPIRIGIDPGKGGGFAVLLEKGATPSLTPFGCESDFLSAMDDIAYLATEEGRPVQVYLEQVGGYVKGCVNTGSSMFEFGRNFGFILGVCQAHLFAVELIHPSVWEAYFHCKTKSVQKAAHKRELKDIARRLFPTLKPVDATADALLILGYALRPLVAGKDKKDGKIPKAETAEQEGEGK